MRLLAPTQMGLIISEAQLEVESKMSTSQLLLVQNQYYCVNAKLFLFMIFIFKCCQAPASLAIHSWASVKHDRCSVAGSGAEMALRR